MRQANDGTLLDSLEGKRITLEINPLSVGVQ